MNKFKFAYSAGVVLLAVLAAAAGGALVLKASGPARCRPT